VRGQQVLIDCFGAIEIHQLALLKGQAIQRSIIVVNADDGRLNLSCDSPRKGRFPGTGSARNQHKVRLHVRSGNALYPLSA